MVRTENFIPSIAFSSFPARATHPRDQEHQNRSSRHKVTAAQSYEIFEQIKRKNMNLDFLDSTFSMIFMVLTKITGILPTTGSRNSNNRRIMRTGIRKWENLARDPKRVKISAHSSQRFQSYMRLKSASKMLHFWIFASISIKILPPDSGFEEFE